jgi:hypothetical protein
VDLPALFASLPTTRAERWRALTDLAGAWFGPLTPEDGFPEQGIRDAEARLGFALPAALREASLLFGRKVELASASEGLWPPRWLDVEGGLLVFLGRSDVEWGIAKRDLAMDDPPVIRRQERKGSRPAFEGDNSFSRFVVIEALHHAAEAGRYVNRAPTASIASVIAEVERSFTRLDIGEAPHAPPRRLYGGHGCIVAVHADRAEVYVSALDAESYRAAVAALGGLRWEWTEQQARRGAFFVHMERMEAELAAIPEAGAKMREMISMGNALASAQRVAPPRPLPSIDPRLADLVTRAFQPYEGLLTRAVAAFFVEAASFALDTYPTLYAWTDAFLQKPMAGDVARPPEPVTPGLEEAIAQMPPSKREIAEGMAAAGVVGRMRVWVEPRAGGSGALALASGVDFVILHQAEQQMQTFLAGVHTRPPADHAACEAQLFHIVRMMMASLFAGIVGNVPAIAAAGHAKACAGYDRARAAFACFEGDRRVWRLYHGPGGHGRSGVMGRLEMSEDEVDDRLRAFLEELATTIETSEEVADLRRATPPPPAAPLRSLGRKAKGLAGRHRKN